MNCRDFSEIADSYLSDELAVETNHEIFKHLENCASCRHELAVRREVKDKLRRSLKNSGEFTMNPLFTKRLRSEVKNEAFRRKKLINWKFLVPVLTGLIIVSGLAFSLSHSVQSTETAKHLSQNELSELYTKAISKHQNCGLKHLKRWEESNKHFEGKDRFVKTLEKEGTEILETHTCAIDSKEYAHFVMRRHGKVFSVLKTESKENFLLDPSEEVSITCRKKKGMKVAGFKVGETLVFVVSDMSESENLNIARELSDSIET